MWYVTVSVRDNERKLSHTGLFLPATVNHGDALDRATALANAVQGVTLGVVAQVTLTDMEVIAPNNTTPTSSNVDNEVKATLAFRTIAGKITRMSIPAVNKVAVMYPNSDQVDPAQPTVAALISEIVTGGWVNADAQDINAYERGFETYTKRSTRRRGA